MTKGDVGQKVQELVRPGMVCVDVGASDGWVCSRMRDAGASRVIAFEPDDRYGDIPGVDLRRVALGAVNGEAELWRGGTKQESTLWRANYDGAQGTVMVPLRRLDDEVEAADLVKVDAQGAEVEILTGAPRLLQSCAYWILELWPRGLGNAGTDGMRLLTLLWDAGLRTEWMDGSVLTPASYAEWVGFEKVYTNVVGRR